MQVRFLLSASFVATACVTLPLVEHPEACPDTTTATTAAASSAPATSIASSSRASAGTPAGPAPVVVTLVVDQLAAWVANERLPHLPNGGFAQLRRAGTWVKELTYLHATTETAPGHAALYTGRIPRDTRIVANAVWRTDLGKSGSLLEDKAEHPVGPAGALLDVNGVSLRNFAGSALADDLLARDPKSVVVGLSLKDRGAAFACGRTPTACVWYDETRGTLTSSTAFLPGERPQLPAFAQRRAQVVPTGVPFEWDASDREFVTAHAHTEDDAPGELGTFGRKFPHQVGAEAAAAAFRLTPRADALLVDLALDALELRDPAHPMLLGVSFSTYDYVGHAYGPDSHESWSALAALDEQLARLFAGLDAKLGTDGYSVVLSGDHGMVPLPEIVSARKPQSCNSQQADRFERPCRTEKRLKADKLRDQLEAAARKALNTATPLVHKLIDARLILTPEARALPPKDRALLDRVLRAELRSVVSSVVALDAFHGPCPDAADESIPALVCRSTAAAEAGRYEIPGDYYLVVRPGQFFWGDEEGATHGAPYRYDRTVPLLVRYPGSAGDQVVERTPFGAFYASAWYALTGERVTLPYGSVVGAAIEPGSTP